MNQSSIKYSVRVSLRARHVRLTVSVQKGLEVVIPRGFDRKRIPAIIEEKRQWIRKAIEKVEHHAEFTPHDSEVKLPDHIFLQAINESWIVQYKEGHAKGVAVYETGEGLLILRGNVHDKPACKAALRRWLVRKAHDRLVPWLRDVSRETGLSFNHVLIRCQKTRWGSCSRHKGISLNLKLLFVPAPLARYIFIHELCHTVHMNHSQRYWKLVASKEAMYASLDKELKSEWRKMPHWI
ncbi:MAG: SprT family zinc-dependent metalloprotease [Nitrospira sp.]|nr:SprT family zinc-dependent metalloprotease [Nitrospira sp.]